MKSVTNTKTISTEVTKENSIKNALLDILYKATDLEINEAAQDIISYDDHKYVVKITKKGITK